MGDDASRVGKRFSYYLVEFIFSSFLYPDAGRVAPISGSVSYQIDRLKADLKPCKGLLCQVIAL